MMKRKVLIIIPVFIVVLLVIALPFTFFFGTRNQILESGVSDEGYQIAIDNELMIPINIEIANSGAKIQKAYFDGLRVYVDMQIADKSNIDISKSSLNDSGGNIFIVDKYVKKDENTFLLIWNDNIKEKDVALQLVTSEGTTLVSSSFQLNTVEAPVLEVERYFEEMFIHTITVGVTSTLFDMEVYTLLEIDKFQIEVKNEARTSVSVLYHDDSKKYSILFPIVIDVEDTIVIYALDTSGNVLMSIPVSLELQQ